MEINNFDELIAFVERKEVTSEHISTIVSKSIGVFCYPQDEKEEMIRQLKEYWARYGNLPIAERPLFLCQKNLNFDIGDIYKETVQK